VKRFWSFCKVFTTVGFCLAKLNLFCCHTCCFHIAFSLYLQLPRAPGAAGPEGLLAVQEATRPAGADLVRLRLAHCLCISYPCQSRMHTELLCESLKFCLNKLSGRHMEEGCLHWWRTLTLHVVSADPQPNYLLTTFA